MECHVKRNASLSGAVPGSGTGVKVYISNLGPFIKGTTENRPELNIEKCIFLIGFTKKSAGPFL